MTMKLMFLIWISASTLLCSSCNNEKRSHISIPTVKTDKAIAVSETSPIQYPGHVNAANEVNLSFKVSGTIDRIFISEGSYVHKGQLLACLDSTDYRVQLDATEAEYNQVKSKSERIMSLYDENGTTPDNYDMARFGLQQITAKYKSHKDQLKYTRMYAPFSGYVQSRFFDTYETVGAGMPVLSIVDEKNTEIEINLSASDFIDKDNFSRYSCTFSIYPEKVFTLEPIGVNRKANSNQLYTMRLRMKDNGEADKIYPGMVTMVTINRKDNSTNLFSVPGNSVFTDKENSYIWSYNPSDGKIRKKEVVPVRLLRMGRSIVRCNSLRNGEIVVASGVHYLKDGEKVNLLPQKSETNMGGLL